MAGTGPPTGSGQGDVARQGAPCAPADMGSVHELRPDAEPLDHVERPHPRIEVGGAKAVHVFHCQAGILDRPLGRLGENLQVAHSVGLPAAGGADPDDGSPAAQIPEAHFASSAANTTRPAPLLSTTFARTRMPIFTSAGGTPSTRLIMRTPSSRSISDTS